MRVFCINLDRSKDRWAFMQGQFDTLSAQVDRLPGLTPDSLPDWLAAEFNGPHRLTHGEIGCYASHLKACQAIVGEGLHHAVVLEDDVALSEGFFDICKSAAARAPAAWDYIHLSTNYKVSVIGVSALPDRHNLVRYCRDPVNTAAYIISNAGARKWLRPQQRVRPNDVDLRYSWQYGLHVYGVYPAIAEQKDSFQSTIDAEQKRTSRNWVPSVSAGLRSHLWAISQLGIGTYLRARVLTAWNSLRRKIDGKRRIAVLG